jgi:hypothetical protein
MKKRTNGATAARSQLSDLEWRFLKDEQMPENNFEAMFLEYNHEGKTGALWQLHRETVLVEHVNEFPGTRPNCWWDYSAPRSPVGTYPGAGYDGELPEPRLRLGGTGTPAHEVLNYKPCFSFGIPTLWVSESDVDYYNRKGLFAHVARNPNSAGPFKGVAIDSDDPPLYESEASYLDRLGLFLHGEKKRLKKADYEPETMAYVE